ncbi:type VII secretion protein EssC [Paenibacillus albidus]|uniref:type VII secretion protein EssC n=1 Tax=Paenibacillus albidus TaxID=2041023 RepID=UPI001BE7D946|nr:type VII secretion protein EssC [Paenibacillus albidus]MBT2293171.1 type VII secretion protein EssC [Paenibacillus albidus]
MAKVYEFSRQPRFLPDMPGGELEIPNPPQAYAKPEIAWMALLVPPAVMLIITVLLAMTAQSMYMMLSIAMTVTTLLFSFTGAATQIRKYNRQKKEREQKYLQYIADVRAELAIAREQQSKALHEMNPEPEDCLLRLQQNDSKLWERTPVHQDFLSLRLGVGSVPSALRIVYSKQAVVLENDPLLMEPHRLALEFAKVPEAPVAVNLLEAEICGVAGEAERTRQLLQQMVLQLVTHHGYDDVRLVLLLPEERVADWSWLRHLPHVWNDDFTSRYLLCGKPMAHPILGELYEVLKERELRTVAGTMLPHYVFIIEDPALLDNEPIYNYLYNGSSRLGVSSLFLASNKAYLPMNSRVVIHMNNKSAELADKISGDKLTFIPDNVKTGPLAQAARKLAPVRLRSTGAGFALPASVTLLETLGVRTTTELDFPAIWNKNKTFKGMSVPIGVRAGGTPFRLDLHETGHGPHGLVAGTTGSGKSELLQSMIVSLAIHYHPHDLVFVLIDYKGGGMADVFKGMPHLVGTITNLGGNETNRALLSIKSELLRRQRLFSEQGVNNIDRYQKLYHSGGKERGLAPIPHLIMIADEFAELKQDQPDFMKELVSAARVGRSLGVHLILATQKPAGIVDDQIWSNAKFKICLKVQDAADSKDVIKRPDAAMIKEPGRAYIQVGNDEIFEMFQSAYSGADYDPGNERKLTSSRTRRIYRMQLNGKSEQIYPLDEEKMPELEVPSQLQSIVEQLAACAERAGIEPLAGPWHPPLPETVTFEDLYSGLGGWSEQTGWPAVPEVLSVPVGIADDPRGQRQEALQFDFAESGNLFVYGAPGTGKTVLLRTLCLSAAYRYSPEDVHLYVMDCGGSSFKLLEPLPHCGGVMTLEQEKQILQFTQFLFRTMGERKRIFEEAGADGFVDYRERFGKLASIVLVIDNYFALSETYEELDEQMIVLAREGTKYGIYLVVSATNASLVRYKFAVNFKNAVSLQMTEKSEYEMIVGRTEGLEPSRAGGRGLVRGKPPLEFQTALPSFPHWEQGGLEGWIAQLRELATAGKLPEASRIPVMPAKIDLAELNARCTLPEGRLAIGLTDGDLQPVGLDLDTTPIVMVAGDAMSGKSTILTSWMVQLGQQAVKPMIYALDSAGMGIYRALDLPYVTDLAAVEDMYALIDEIKEELDRRRRAMLEARTAGRDLGSLLASWPRLLFVIDRLSEFTGGDQYSLKELLERVVKQDRALKVAVIAADNTAELAGNWDGLGKAIREEQCGLLLGSLKEQNLYNVRVPYGEKEKELEPGDGYLILKNKYSGLRAAT